MKDSRSSGEILSEHAVICSEFGSHDSSIAHGSSARPNFAHPAKLPIVWVYTNGLIKQRLRARGDRIANQRRRIGIRVSSSPSGGEAYFQAASVLRRAARLRA